MGFSMWGNSPFKLNIYAQFILAGDGNGCCSNEQCEEEEELASHGELFYETNIHSGIPLRQGGKCGKKRSRKATVKEMLRWV
jgi:hypothetical protein